MTNLNRYIITGKYINWSGIPFLYINFYTYYLKF